MNGIWLVVFAIAAGFTASGLMASLYRVCGFTADGTGGRVLHAAVLVVAGPSILFENAMRGFLRKEWQPMTFWLTTAGVLYWSLAVGLLVIEIGVSL